MRPGDTVGTPPGRPTHNNEFYMIPGLSMRARHHPAISQVSEILLAAVARWPEDERLILLELANAILEPLLECGSSRPKHCLKKGHPDYGHVEKVLDCVRDKDMTSAYQEFWTRSVHRDMVKNFILRRHANCRVTWGSKEVCRAFLYQVYYAALVALTPSDVDRGLPDSKTPFREAPKYRGNGEVVQLYCRAA